MSPKNIVDTFGADTVPLAMLLHLVARLDGLVDGPFKSGFETAIDEAAAYLDSTHEDGVSNAQTLLEQMCGLVHGYYVLTPTDKPFSLTRSNDQ